MKRMRLTVRRVDKMRVSRAQVSRELVQGVAPNEDARRRVEDAVIDIEFRDRLTTAASIAFAENLLEVAV
jgi:hypothetical protein